MAYQDNNSGSRPSYGGGGGGRGFGPRPKTDVSSLNIMCVECGKQINELPFEPSIKEDGTYGKIYCFECNAKRPRREFRPRGGGGGYGGGSRGGSRSEEHT